MPARVVVLISGSGSNLQALIDAGGADKGYEVVGVISNKPGVKGLERAQLASIPGCVVDHTQYANREAFDEALLACVKTFSPDIVALAGFMRILTAVFVAPLHGKMLNIHPSLLPKYAGLNTHQRAIDAGDSFAGCTVHFVTEALDGGPAVLQAKVAIENDDNAASLAAKVLQLEHQIYPAAVDYLATGRLRLCNKHAELDEQALGVSGTLYN